MEVAKAALVVFAAILGGVFAFWAWKINCEEHDARKGVGRKK